MPRSCSSFLIIFYTSLHGREVGEAALRWAQSKIGAKYDKLDVAVIVLDRVLKTLKLKGRDHSRFSCGEFVACAWQHAGADLFPSRDASEIVPTDFAVFLPGDVRQRD